MVGFRSLERAARTHLSEIFEPERFVALCSLARRPALWAMAHEPFVMAEPPRNPQTLFGNLLFRNDLGNAAGIDKNGELLDRHYRMGAGFAVVGTVLDSPHPGNLIRAFGLDVNPWTPLPHSGSAINSLGLPSEGIDVVTDNIVRFHMRYSPADFPIGISLMGHPAKEGEEKLRGLEEVAYRAATIADFIELNESCPNVAHGEGGDAGLRMRVSRVISAVRRFGKYVPVLVKLGSVGDARETVRAFTEMGVDGIVAFNTQKDYANLRPGIDTRDLPLFDHYTQHHSGGVSGRAIRQRSYEQMAMLAEEIRRQCSPLVLVHVGGIGTRADVEESRRLAPLREWYTGLMDATQQFPTGSVYREVVSCPR